MEDDLNTSGWAMPSEGLYTEPPPLEIPALRVRRGGIKFLRYPVYTNVRKAGWHEFYVKVRVHMQEEPVEIGPFTRRRHAIAAQEVVMDMARRINELVEASK